MTPAEVETLFQSRPPLGVAGVVEGQPDSAEHEEALKVWELEKLLQVVRYHWELDSEELDLYAEKLGDGSRDESWRLAIGTSGLLDFFLEVLEKPDLRQALKIHALRLIGNACADTDENRDRVVSSNRLSSIILLLADDSILAFVIPVLYNICVDYEPAQIQACEACLSIELVSILAGPRLMYCHAFLNIICKLLALLIAQEPEKKLADPETPVILLKLATDPAAPLDLEDFCGLTSVALAYLTHEDFQTRLLHAGGVPALFSAFTNSYTYFDVSTADTEEAEQLDRVRNAFVQAVSEITGLDAFLSVYLLGSPIVQQIQSWLRMPPALVNLQSAACLALGNLARSDVTSTALVSDLQVHRILIDIVANALASSPISPSAPPPPHQPTPPPPSSQLLYAVLSCLKNLAIPPANKPILGELLLEAPRSLLPRLWTSTDTQPQVQFAAVSLTRLLLVGCVENVRRICAPLSADPASPAHSRSNLHVLVTLHDRVDAEPTKMESARAVAAICRILHTCDAPTLLTILPSEWHDPATRLPPGLQPKLEAAGKGEAERRRAQFYAAHATDDPLVYLILQTRFPALRSEAWFVLALMSRDPDGTNVVACVINSLEATRALVEAVTGRDLFQGQDLSSSASSGGDEDGDTVMSAVTTPGGVTGMDSLQGLLQQEQQQEQNRQTGSPPAAAAHSSSSSTAVAAAGDSEAMVGELGLSPKPAAPADASSPSAGGGGGGGGGGGPVNLRRVDRENGLVLLANVLRDYDGWIPPFRLSVFQQLLQTGGELVLHTRLMDAGAREGGKLGR